MDTSIKTDDMFNMIELQMKKIKHIFDVESDYELDVVDDIDSYIINRCIDLSSEEILNYFAGTLEKIDPTNDFKYEQKIINEFKMIIILWCSQNEDHAFPTMLSLVENKHIKLIDLLLKYEGNSEDILDLMNHIKSAPFSIKNKILTNLSESINFRTMILLLFKNEKNGMLEEHCGLMSMFIEKYNHDDNDNEFFDTNIDHIVRSIDQFLNGFLDPGYEYEYCEVDQNFKNLDTLITYINNVYSLNNLYTQLYHQTQTSTQTNGAKESSSIKFCVTLCKILLYVHHKLDESLSIKYTVMETNIRTKIISTILHSLQVSYISLSKLKDIISQEIHNINHDIFSVFNGIIGQGNNTQTKKLLNKKKKRIESLQNDTSLSLQIKTFMEHMIIEFNKNNIKFSDDFIIIFNDFILSKIYDSDDFSLTGEQVSYLFEIISSKIETNKHIRFTTCLVILKYSEIKGYVKLYESNNNIMAYGLSSVLKFISDVNYFEMVQPPTVYTFHQNLLNFINYHCNKLRKLNDDNNDIVNHINNHTLPSSLCDTSFYKIISYANKFIFDIMKICKSISDSIIEKNAKGLELIMIKQQISPIILEYIKNCMATIQTLCNFMTSNIVNISEFSEEFILSLSSFILSTINYLSNGKELIYEVLHMNIETKDLLCELFELLNIACNNQHFINALVDKVPLISEICRRHKFNAKIQDEILNKLQNISINVVDDDELPSEFCDPFLYTEIKNPVMIPHCNQIFDKLSIMAHLRLTSSNPITSECLTIDEFNEFNDASEIKNLIEDFNKRKSNYKILNSK